jgi:hypothetical protein
MKSLMDHVEYHDTDAGTRVVMVKQSRSGIVNGNCRGKRNHG